MVIDGQGRWLEFEIENTGNQDIELLRLECGSTAVRIPTPLIDWTVA
jgi:hypothetical protein